MLQTIHPLLYPSPHGKRYLLSPKSELGDTLFVDTLHIHSGEFMGGYPICMHISCAFRPRYNTLSMRLSALVMLIVRAAIQGVASLEVVEQKVRRVGVPPWLILCFQAALSVLPWSKRFPLLQLMEVSQARAEQVLAGAREVRAETGLYLGR
jgi:hypothetical protein